MAVIPMGTRRLGLKTIDKGIPRMHGVLRHRIILNYKAEAAGITADDIVTKILQAIKLP